MSHEPIARRRTVQTLPTLGLFLAASLVAAGPGSAQVAIAESESTRAGTVTGSYIDTGTSDDLHEVVTEELSGGKPARRTSYLEHTWVFNVPVGNAATFHLEAFHTANTEGDHFIFAYSTNGGTSNATWTEILTLTKTVDDGLYLSQPLAPGTAGTVHVRVMDSDRGQGRTQLDQVCIDHMFIEVQGTSGPPTAPTDLVAEASSPSSIDLWWSDNSANEDGFELERSLDGLLWSPLANPAANVTTHRDDGLLSATTYHYRVRAENMAGSSTWSNVALAATLPASSYSAELVDGNSRAQYSDLAYDPQTEYPAIAYFDNAFARVAQWNGSGWDLETVGSPWSGGIDIAFSPGGRLSVCYGWGDLQFAEKIGSTWAIETVDRDVYEDGHSLVYDAQGQPSLVYRRSGGGRWGKGLWFAQRIGGIWVKDRVDAEGTWARYRSHAFHPLTGDPAIAYSDVDTLKVALWSGGSWAIEVVESGSGYGIKPSIAFDPSTGYPAIVHSVLPYPTGPAEMTRLVRWDGSSWQAEMISSGHGGGLAIDDSGTMFVSYGLWGSTSVGLWIANSAGGAWQHEWVDAVSPGTFIMDMRLDPWGQPSLSYEGEAAGVLGLKFAHR